MEEIKCSFCGKSSREVIKVIEAKPAYICNECIDLCNEILENKVISKCKCPLLEYLAKEPDAPVETKENTGQYYLVCQNNTVFVFKHCPNCGGTV
ncbi:MAG: hypothetical protein J0M03_23965 [Acidobacteria bacterium]|nr:hypothetical protein [Acidobacteriota bacterium]